jgi:hypothetical protein
MHIERMGVVPTSKGSSDKCGKIPCGQSKIISISSWFYALEGEVLVLSPSLASKRTESATLHPWCDSCAKCQIAMFMATPK